MPPKPFGFAKPKINELASTASQNGIISSVLRDVITGSLDVWYAIVNKWHPNTFPGYAFEGKARLLNAGSQAGSFNSVAFRNSSLAI